MPNKAAITNISEGTTYKNPFFAAEVKVNVADTSSLYILNDFERSNFFVKKCPVLRALVTPRSISRSSLSCSSVAPSAVSRSTAV